MSDFEDGDSGGMVTNAARPNSELSIELLLTELQRLHIERMLEAVQSGVPNPAVMAQINRYLMNNGIVVAPPDGPLIEGHRNKKRPVLPNFHEQRYDE